MRYLNSRLLFLLSCFWFLGSSFFITAQASEEKAEPLSSAVGEAIQEEAGLQGGASLPAVNGGSNGKMLGLKRRYSETFSGDLNNDKGEGDTRYDVMVKEFSEFSDRQPVVIVKPKQERAFFSVPWKTDMEAEVVVLPWDANTRSFEPANALSADELNIKTTTSDGKLEGKFEAALLSKHGWLFRVLVYSRELLDGLFVESLQLVFLDGEHIHGITLLDANTIGEEAKGKELNVFSKNKGKGGFRDDELVVLMADTRKPYFRGQLPQSVVYMTKDAVLEHEETFKKLVHDPMHENDDEMEWRSQKREELISALKLVRGAVEDAVDAAEPSWGDTKVGRTLASYDKVVVPYPGMEDFIFDPLDFYITLGPVQINPSRSAAIQVALRNGEKEAANWVPIHPVGKTLSPVLDSKHFPSSSNSFYELLWFRNQNVIGKIHGLMLKPEVLKSHLVIVDLSVGKFRRRSSDISVWTKQLVAEVDDPNNVVLVVGGSIQESEDIKQKLSQRAVLHFADVDDDKESYLKGIISKFQGGKDIYRYSPDSKLFEDQGLELKTIEVAGPVDTLAATKQSVRRPAEITPPASEAAF